MLIGRQILNQPLEDVLRFKKKKKAAAFRYHWTIVLTKDRMPNRP